MQEYFIRAMHLTQVTTACCEQPDRYGSAIFRGFDMMEWKVSRHRHLFGIAIVQRSNVKSAAERRGIGPAAIRKEVVLPWTPMATPRKTRWFWPIGAGGTVNDTGYESISGNRISNCKRFGLNFNCLSSSTDGIHGPVRPMAAHQLELMGDV
jgi:hypothetical protein